MRTFFNVLIAIAIVGLTNVSVAAQDHASIWSGVFTETQAARGGQAFAATCARCHLADLTGKNGPPLIGDQFFEEWREASLEILFAMVKSMPPSSARNPTPRLPETVSLDILTYLLKKNGAPAGAQELTTAALPAIQFEKQSGPEAVPNLTLVRLVGCIRQASPTAWTLASASEPVRAMNPDVLSPADVSAGTSIGLGTNSYQLSQVGYINTPILQYKDHAAVIKGTLIRQLEGSTRISLTALETIAATCP
jgi:hypothetical protein